MLKVQHITKRFNGLTALDDVTFSCEDRGILGIAGPNGSGKTTLLNLLTGNYRLNEGEIHFSGKRIDMLSLQKRSDLLLVRTYQDGRVWLNHTVKEQLELTQRWGGWSANGNTDIDALLVKVGLTGKRDDPAWTLSFGQRRRLELARALVRSEMKLFLFDEPSSGGDPGFEHVLTETLQGLSGKGKLVMVVEHNLNLLSCIADRLLILEGGRLLAYGTPTEIFRNQDVTRAYLGANSVA